MSDKLKIPSELSHRISTQKTLYKPELEILLIIAENKLSDFEKVKFKQRPKDFCKQHIIYHHRKYDNSTEFYNEYFGDRIPLLIESITKYHQTHGKHKADEGYLFDLLK